MTSIYSLIKTLLSYLFPTSFSVNGRSFQIVDVMHNGGFSNIYLVKYLNSYYALKKVSVDSPIKEMMVKKEMQISKMVSNRALIKVIEYQLIEAENSKNVLFVMNFYERSLAPSSGNLSEEKVLKYISEVANAVKYLNMFDPPLAHRDIKPQGMLIDSDDKIIICDLGSIMPAFITVRNEDEATKFQDIINLKTSPKFRAPELSDIKVGSKITQKTDIWSLGCSIYYLAHGYLEYDSKFQENLYF